MVLPRAKPIFVDYKEGYVYFACLATDSTIVKVGWSCNPWCRILEIGYSLREKLTLRGVIEIAKGSKLWGTYYDGLEQQVHRAIAVHRLPGEHEWYRLTDVELRDVFDLARRFAENGLAQG